MGIQRKSQRSLKDVIEGQPSRVVVEKPVQPNLPPPLPLHPRPPQPPVTEPSDPKRRREPKDKEVVDAGRSRTTRENEDQRAAKQQKVSHGSQRVADKTTTQSSKLEAWLPAPMLGEEPLREDALIRNFNDGLGCHIASALEETLLLPKDMAELRTIKSNEVFQNAKRYLGMAVQATFKLEEITNSYYQQIEVERKKKIATVQTLNAAEQNVVQLKKKLSDEENARKSADSALDGVQRQVEDQRKLLRDANAQLATSQGQILTLQKQLEEAQRLRDQAEKAKAEVEKAKAEVEKERDATEQHGYDVGVAKTEDNFRAEVPVVCREYCALTWQEALNRAGVEPSSELRRPENVYLPLAIRAPSPSTQQGEAPSTAAESIKEAQTLAPPSVNQ
nr:cilia- and flagella-associated protein 99-like [Quercus suber]